MPFPTGVRDAVVTAYYPRALGAPDTARSRAQAGYTVASAVAAALIAAGVLSGIDKRPVLVQGLGLTALVLWMITALLFMWAVSAPVRVVEGDQPTADAFVTTALSNAKLERDEVDKRQRAARIASVAAVLLTLAAFVTALLLPSDLASPSISVNWSRSDKTGKLSVKIEVADLRRGSQVVTEMRGLKSGSEHVVLLRGDSRADANGKVAVESQLSIAKGAYRQFEVRVAVKGRDRTTREDTVTLTPS